MIHLNAALNSAFRTAEKHKVHLPTLPLGLNISQTTEFVNDFIKKTTNQQEMATNKAQKEIDAYNTAYVTAVKYDVQLPGYSGSPFYCSNRTRFYTDFTTKTVAEHEEKTAITAARLAAEKYGVVLPPYPGLDFSTKTEYYINFTKTMMAQRENTTQVTPSVVSEIVTPEPQPKTTLAAHQKHIADIQRKLSELDELLNKFPLYRVIVDAHLQSFMPLTEVPQTRLIPLESEVTALLRVLKQRVNRKRRNEFDETEFREFKRIHTVTLTSVTESIAK